MGGDDPERKSPGGDGLGCGPQGVLIAVPGELIENHFAAFRAELRRAGGKRVDAPAVGEGDGLDGDGLTGVVKHGFVESFGCLVEKLCPPLTVQDVLSCCGVVCGAEPHVPPTGHSVAHVLVALDVGHASSSRLFPDFELAVVEQPGDLVRQKVPVKIGGSGGHASGSPDAEDLLLDAADGVVGELPGLFCFGLDGGVFFFLVALDLQEERRHFGDKVELALAGLSIGFARLDCFVGEALNEPVQLLVCFAAYFGKGSPPFSPLPFCCPCTNGAFGDLDAFGNVGLPEVFLDVEPFGFCVGLCFPCRGH